MVDVDLPKSVEDLKKAWKELLKAATAKMLKLDQANAYCSFRTKLNQINYQFGKISVALSQDIDGLNLPELKVMGKRHAKTEHDMKVVETSVVELRTIGEAMIEYGHGAAQEIRDNLKEMDKTLSKLQIGVKKKRVSLTFKIDVKQLTIDVERHCDWIVNQKEIINNKEDQRNVEAAIEMLKEIKNIRLGKTIRKRAVDATLLRGHRLERDGADGEVKAGIIRLQSSWDNLGRDLDLAFEHWEFTLKLRRTRLEVESSKTWTANMTVYLESLEYGKTREDVTLIEEQLQLLTIQIDLKKATADASKVWLSGLEDKESKHPEVQPLEGNVKELMKQLQNLEIHLQKAQKALTAVLDLFYFLAETDNLFRKRDSSVLAQERPFASTGFLQDLLQTADGLDGLPIHPELATEVSRRKEMLADKLARRHARRSSRSLRDSSDSSSTSSDSSDSSDDEGRRDKTDSVEKTKPSKVSKHDQWNANVDFLLSLINEKLKQTPEIVKPADLQETRRLESTQRVSEMDVAWMEPAVQRVSNDHRILKRKRKISSEALDDIDSKQSHLTSKWATLKGRLDKRKITLFRALQFYQFINEVNALSDFFAKLMNAMANPDAKSTSHDQLDAHAVIMFELTARESVLVVIQENGHTMIAAEHFGAEKIKSLLSELAEKKNRVIVEWHKRNDYLLQCFDLEKFQREAKNIEDALEGLEKKLNVSILPNTVQETYNMLNSHAILERQVSEGSERLAECRLKADSMVQAKHFYSEGITQRTDGLQKKLQKIEYSVSVRKRTLYDQEAFIKFSASVSMQIEYLTSCDRVLVQATKRQQRLQQRMKKKTAVKPSSRRSSLSSKASSTNKKSSKKSGLARFVDTIKQKFDSSDSDSSSSSISSRDSEKEDTSVKAEDREEVLLNRARVKKLSLFKIFMEEFESRSKLIEGVEARGNEMIQQQHVASDRIKLLLDDLSRQQKKVKKAMEDHQYALELERDKARFQALKRDLRLKIKEIESANPTGDKYNEDKEEVLRLKSQLDLLADAHENFNQHYEEKVFDGIDSVVEELITKDTAHSNFFVQKKSDIKNSWKSAVNTLNNSRKLMDKTLDLLLFKENTNLIAEEIANLDNMMDSMDPSGTIHEVAHHISSYRTYVTPMMPLVSDWVDENETTAKTLGSKYPQDIKFINTIHKDVKTSWQKLKSKFDGKERQLQQAFDVLKFDADAKELEKWLNDMLKKVDTVYLFETVQQCELVLEGHDGLKVLLNSRDDDFAKFQETFKKYIAQAKEKGTAKKRVQAILLSKSKLEKAWSVRMKVLQDELLLLRFRSSKAKFEEELREKKRQTEEDIPADSVRAIELALHAQTLLHIDLGELEHLQKLIKLISKDIKETENLPLQLSRLVEEKNAVAVSIKWRGERLEAKLALLQYRLQVDTILPSIKEQIQVVDSTDSPSSSMQLSVVKGNLKTWASMVESTVKKGEELLKANVNKKAVEALMKDLQDSWQQLQDKAARDQAISDLKEKMKEYRSSSKELLQWIDQKLDGCDVVVEEKVDDVKELQDFLRTYLQLRQDGLVVSTKVDELTKQRKDLEQDYPGCFEDDDDFSDDEFDSGRVLVLEDEWARFKATVEERIDSLSRIKATLELLSLHDQLMQWMTEIHDKIMEEADQVDGKVSDINLRHKKLEDVVKEVDRRASEVDKLLYTWKSAKEDPIDKVARKDELEEKFDALEAEWKALNKLASDRKAVLDHNLDAQEVLRKMQLLDEFLDTNEELVQEEDEMEKPVEEVEDEIKRLDVLLKQMEYYENNFKAIKDKTFEELPEFEEGSFPRSAGKTYRKSSTSSESSKNEASSHKKGASESAKSDEEIRGSDSDEQKDYESDDGKKEAENDHVDNPSAMKKIDRDSIVKKLVKEAEANLKKEQKVERKETKSLQAEEKAKTSSKSTNVKSSTTKKPKTQKEEKKPSEKVGKKKTRVVYVSASEDSESSSNSDSSASSSSVPSKKKSSKNRKLIKKKMKENSSESESDSEWESEGKFTKSSKVVKPAVKPPVRAKAVQPKPITDSGAKSKSPETRSPKKGVSGGKKIGAKIKASTPSTSKKRKTTKISEKKRPSAELKKKKKKGKDTSSSSSSSDSDQVDGLNEVLSEFEEETAI